jgi:GTP cyclohydrolase II
LPVEAFVTDDNRAYLLTKQARLGHLLDVEPGVVSR